MHHHTLGSFKEQAEISRQDSASVQNQSPETDQEPGHNWALTRDLQAYLS